MTWVLIWWVGWYPGNARQPTTAGGQVVGYASLAQCEKAGEKFRIETQPRAYGSLPIGSYTCIPGPTMTKGEK